MARLCRHRQWRNRSCAKGKDAPIHTTGKKLQEEAEGQATQCALVRMPWRKKREATPLLKFSSSKAKACATPSQLHTYIAPTCSKRRAEQRAHAKAYDFRTCGSQAKHHGTVLSIVRHSPEVSYGYSTATAHSPPHHHQKRAAMLACSTCMYSCTRLRNAHGSFAERARASRAQHSTAQL
jgi:hypothetical protein